MLRVRSWGLAQRIVVVVALGLALAVLGRYLASVGHRSEFGWYAYAPLNSSPPAPAVGPAPWTRALIWLGVVVVWAVPSVLLLRPRTSGASSSETPAGRSAPLR